MLVVVPRIRKHLTEYESCPWWDAYICCFHFPSSSLENHSKSYRLENLFETYFLAPKIVQNTMEKPNIYSTLFNVNCSMSVEALELRQYIGLLIRMHCISLFECEIVLRKENDLSSDHKTFRNKQQCIIFNSNKLQVMKCPIHSNFHPQNRAFIDALGARFTSFPLEQRLSVDEKVCGT